MIRSVRVLLFLLLAVVLACSKSVPPSEKVVTLSSSVIHTTATVDSASFAKTQDSINRIQDSIRFERRMDLVERDGKKLFGYRFSITGDFDGRGKECTLTEHYYSRRDKKETNKFYKDLKGNDAGDLLIGLAVRKKPISFLTSNDSSLPPFYLPIDTFGQLFGLSLLRNEGDLDGNGTEEISFVMDWADYSAMNSCCIASFIKGGWHILYQFEIRDWQLPPLPNVRTAYGFFGVEAREVTPEKKALLRAENGLHKFPGFIKKLPNGKIKVHTFDKELTTIWKTVDLKKILEKI